MPKYMLSYELQASEEINPTTGKTKDQINKMLKFTIERMKEKVEQNNLLKLVFCNLPFLKSMHGDFSKNCICNIYVMYIM